MMKHNSNSTFVDATVMLFSFIFTVAGIIPIIGPAVVAYCLGRNKYRNESYGLFKRHIFVSILISASFSFLIGFLINQLSGDLFNPKMFWRIIIIALISNLIVSLILFFIGDWWARRKR